MATTTDSIYDINDDVKGVTTTFLESVDPSLRRCPERSSQKQWIKIENTMLVSDITQFITPSLINIIMSDTCLVFYLSCFQF
jgi:hypothetical protein